MRLFLIRHGESVDNVAGVYAGSRDSSLTAHGVLQARRLASSLAESYSMTHIFSSPLQRAAKTAQAVCDAQRQAHGPASLAFTMVPELQEKDFGSLEGVSFRQAKPICHDAETKQAIQARACRFWDEHVLPLLHSEANADAVGTCAVVAHGILLRVLASIMFDKLPTTMSLASGTEGTASAAGGPDPVLPRGRTQASSKLSCPRDQMHLVRSYRRKLTQALVRGTFASSASIVCHISPTSKRHAAASAVPLLTSGSEL